MIEYKKTKYKELSGDYEASIGCIEVEDSPNHNPSMANSTPQTLTITFAYLDPTTDESCQFVQRFVSPLTGGKGLFQQLLDAVEYMPDLDGGFFDEQKLIGVPLIITFGKNKKNYDTVIAAKARDSKPKTAQATGEDLPWEK